MPTIPYNPKLNVKKNIPWDGTMLTQVLSEWYSSWYAPPPLVGADSGVELHVLK